MMPTTPYLLSASLVCANMLRLEDEIRQIEAGGIDTIHFDVMDGSFVPRFGLHPEILQGVRSLTKLPIDVHMMTDNPETYIDAFAAAGATHYSVHAEACPHLHRTVQRIRSAGMIAGVALNPATPLGTLSYVLQDIELVVIMAINPGVLGQKLIPEQLDKIKQLRAMVAGRPDFLIQVDGGVTLESAPVMIEHGANALVCGTGTIFRPNEAPIDTKTKELRTQLDTRVAVHA